MVAFKYTACMQGCWLKQLSGALIYNTCVLGLITTGCLHAAHPYMMLLLLLPLLPL